MPNQLDIPVVFLVFNRPELTSRVFARIRDARPTTLFVVADGPRPDHPGDAEKCRRVRELIIRGVDWPCEVIRDFSEINLGTARRVPEGITNAFHMVTEAVILEDDCLPDPTFFPFCAELLERHRDDPRVGQIAGDSFLEDYLPTSSSYYFTQYAYCWGWATWRRAWRLYDHTMSHWRGEEAATWLKERFPTRSEQRYWEYVLAATAAGKIAAWDYRWTISLWANRCVNVAPAVNLVKNIGFGPEATNTFDGNSPDAFAMKFPLRHPAALIRDESADEEAGRRVFRLPSFKTRLANRIRRWLR
jgi:hypothetical protein